MRPLSSSYRFFLIPGGRLVFRLFFLTLYEEGIRSGISLSFTLLNIAGIFIWFFQTTETKEIIRALEDSGVHYKAAYIMLSTFQMIDVLSQNSKTILNAQRARGIETDGNLLLRIKAFIPVLLPPVSDRYNRCRRTGIGFRDKRLSGRMSQDPFIECKAQRT